MSIYSQNIYGAQTYIVSRQNDFLITVYDYHTNALLTEEVNWELYRRDLNRDPDELVNDSHIFVASGNTSTGIIEIFLYDYGLRDLQTEFYLRTWNSDDHKYINHLRIKYYPGDYIADEVVTPYFREAIQVQREWAAGGGMGPGVSHTEYRDRPLPEMRVMLVDEDEINDNREKMFQVINIIEIS